jgi:2-keto-3-deoxy-L-rhamnonate aldolase RhmA
VSENFRTRLRRGDSLVGLITAIDSPEVIEVLTGCGFDWLFIDAEHSPLSPASVQRMIMAAGAMPCVVRVPANNEIWIKQALDSGASGIIVPLVNSAAEAALAVQRAKYPPLGVRGVGTARALGYGYGIADYVARANQDTAVIVQAEHKDAVAAIDDIVAVPGIDAIFVGPFDLSLSLGVPGQMEHPAVVDGIERVRKATRAAGLPLGYFGVTPENVRTWMAREFTLVACGVDYMMLGARAREIASTLRN